MDGEHDEYQVRTTLLRIAAAGIGGGAAFLLLMGYRTDYVGHFLAGFGGTLGLLAFPLATLRDRLRWEPLVVALFAIALGAAAEATVFRIAMFDPVDFCNQSIGAVLAAVAVQDRRPHLVAASGAGLLAFVFLTLGFRYAFA